MLCYNLNGWDEGRGGREVQREGTYVNLWLIHADVWRKSSQYCNHIPIKKKKNLLANARDIGSIPGLGRFQRRQWQSTPVLLPGKSHGWRSLVGCSPWGREELDTTERLHFHFSLSCTGEGKGNPLQCSCLENPRDGGAWWAAIDGVAQSRT